MSTRMRRVVQLSIIAFLAFLLLVIVLRPFVNSIVAQWENEESWGPEPLESSVIYSAQNGSYSGISFSVRQLKSSAEIMGLNKATYLESIDRLKASIKDTVDASRLPYDLRQSNADDIAFGLCSTSPRRLGGSKRSEEVIRICDEIRNAIAANDGVTVSGYSQWCDRMYQLDALTKEDMGLLKAALKGQVPASVGGRSLLHPSK